MADVKRGDIWLVNLDPTVGSEIRKARPSVIIQNDLGNKHSQITIIAPITSQKTDQIHPFEVFIPKESGLPKDSKVLLNQIRAIDKQRLIKKLSSLNQSIMEKINDALKVSLEL